jgi:anastral spindle protein 1
MECLKKLEQEKATLDVENNEKLKKIEELNDREQKICEREIRLENKLKELFRKQQEKEKEIVSSSSSSESLGDAKKIVAPPVEIIIKVQPTKSPRKKKKTIDTLSREPGKVYPKTPVKKTKKIETATSSEVPTVITVQNPKNSQKNIPKEQIRPILKRSSQCDDNSSSTSYRSIPDQFQNEHSEVPDVPYKEQPATSRKQHHKLNPTLMHYITRLLGMSTNIGGQLNVDVSSVSTPGSSTINTSGNNSAILVEPSFDANRLQKLQQFIDDNYSFLNEVNETIESVQQEQINDKRMEGIWRDALNKKKPSSVVTSGKDSLERENKSDKKNNSKTSIRPVVLQDATTVRIPKSREIQQKEVTKVTTHIESSMLTNYAEYTNKCRQRIEDLTRMMEQVRREKLRLIENSLSSGEFNNFTEYREIAQQKASSDRAASSQREDPPSEEINNILQKQTRPFGVSKDSGISILSRPVTSSDFRDSPDTRGISEENANVFQPIKTPKVKITTSEGESETIKDVSQMIKQQQKPQRPPLSLKSFSPQVEKQHEPHELSTIAEIETPTASKVNLVPDDTNLPGKKKNYILFYFF